MICSWPFPGVLTCKRPELGSGLFIFPFTEEGKQIRAVSSEGHLEAKHEEKNLNPTSSTKPSSHKPSKSCHGNHFNQCD